MEEAIQKADVLIEALGWIRRFRDKTTVIKLGGSVLEHEDSLRHILIDIVFMETVGMRPVVVHGGGASISRAMEQAGIQPRFIQGRRYTDGNTLQIVTRILAGQLNEQLARTINEFGGHAQHLNFSSGNVLYGRRLTLTDSHGSPIDLGHVGYVTRVDCEPIRRLCSQGCIPVIPSMCSDEQSGQPLNVNADTVATAVAKALQAEKLVYVSDVNGVRRDRDDPSTHIDSLTESQARKLIEEGHIAAGMIPKVEACLETLAAGVRKVHIIDGCLRHSLLLEIYTNKGVGTELVRDEQLVRDEAKQGAVIETAR